MKSNMKDSKLVLYNLKWQILRMSLKFDTVDNVIKSTYLLNEYLKKDKPTEQGINRAWRVLNLLNAVRMGFSGARKLRPMTIKSIDEKDVLVKLFRKSVSSMYGALKAMGETLKPDSEAQMEEDIKNADIRDLSLLYKDLRLRYRKSGYSKHRPELKFYICLIEKHFI